MATTRRTSSANASGGASQSGTPERSRSLPTHANLKSLMAVDTGPVRNIQEARKWLESKGWILAADPYDRTTLTNILVTAALTSKPPELKSTVIAVAFILEADIADRVSDTLAAAVASKATDRLEGLIGKLGTSIEFLSANDTKRAEATLSIEGSSSTLSGLTTSLGVMVNRLEAASTQNQAQAATWASIVKGHQARTPLPPPPTFSSRGLPVASPGHDSLRPKEHARVQQRLLQSNRTVLVSIDKEDDNAPKDFTTEGTTKLREHLNATLAKLDAKSSTCGSHEEGEISSQPPATRVVGMKMTSGGAYLLEFASTDSAKRFREYADSEWTALEDIFGYSMMAQPKAYALIARFVPCNGPFDPANRDSLDVVERENNLPQSSITSAFWLKKPELRHPNQEVATLRVICSDSNVANNLIQGRVFIGGCQIVVRKDIKEPLRCNNCQHYGHLRHMCKDVEHCARCAEQGHAAYNCTSKHPRCVSCGASSTHDCTDRSCPTFLRLCEELDARLPENRMPLFPTEDPSSWATLPPRNPSDTPPVSPQAKNKTNGLPAPPRMNSLHIPRPGTASQPQGPPIDKTPNRLGNLDEFGFTVKTSSRKQRSSPNAPLSSQ